MERSDHIAFVVCKHDRLKNKARALSEYLGVDLREEPNKTAVGKYLKYGRDYYIEFKDALVCLKSLDHKNRLGLRHDHAYQKKALIQNLFLFFSLLDQYKNETR